MKKIYQIIMLSAMSIALVGCAADYRKAVKDGDFDTAHDVLDQLHEAYMQETKRYNNEDFDKAKNAYFEALNYVYENEVRVIASQDMNSGEKIAYLISEIPLDGETPVQGLCDYHKACDVLNGDFFLDSGIEWYRYINSVQAVNRICDKTMNLAISQNNENLARAVINQYKDDIEISLGSGSGDVIVDSIRVDGNHGYVKYTTKSKDAAQEKVIKKFGNE